MFKFLLVLSIFAGTNSFIVPGELPTILSLVYSNIPTIKKGTDSRLGWGFRLGDRAEFQVLVELGPQTNTQPLGNQQSTSNSKRNSADTLTNILYAQRQHEKKAQFSDSEGGKWLKEWSQFAKEVPAARPQPPKRPIKNSLKLNEITKGDDGENSVLGIGEIDAKLVIPEDIDEKIALRKTTIAPKTTTSKEDALDNVAIEDD